MNAKIKAATIIIRKIVPMSQHELFTHPCSNRDDDDNDGDEKMLMTTTTRKVL